jgi:hypothetical protein
MVEKKAIKPADFKIGHRVLFRHRARPALWLSGAVVDGPKSKKNKLLYQVQLDNGESRWATTAQLRNAQL